MEIQRVVASVNFAIGKPSVKWGLVGINALGWKLCPLDVFGLFYCFSQKADGSFLASS